MLVAPHSTAIQANTRKWPPENPKSVATSEQQHLHCSGNPMVLPHINNTLLLVAHFHTDEHVVINRSHAPKYGNTYASYFLVVEGSPPYRVMAQSPAWCPPSAADHMKCASVHSVTSILLMNRKKKMIPTKAAKEQVVVAFGVNDCDSRVMRIPLYAVLAFAYSGNITLSNAPLSLVPH